MKTRPFSPAKIPLPVVGEGTWNMERDDRAQAVAAIRRGIDLGVTHVDTAELYGRGRVEEIVAEAIEGRRDEVYLVSKVIPSNASRQGAVDACERSLRRLKTDRLDLYLLHWPGQHPLEDTVAAFESLARDGKIRAWGVSNFDVDDLDALLRCTTADRIACNQVLYHLEERAIEHRVIPWCEARGVSVVGYSPFGSGSFPSAESSGGRALAAVAEKHGVSAHAAALAFLARRPSVFVIPKASDPRHVEANAKGGEVTLDDDDLAAIDRAFPLGRSTDLPTL